MQPYFFPYIGYWQLIHAADLFLLLDDTQYMRHGWINRNRILKPGGGWQYILVPLEKHGRYDPIKTITAQPHEKWKQLIVRQLTHYKKKAPYYEETLQLINDLLFSQTTHHIATINYGIIKKLCAYLDMRIEILLTSDQHFDYTHVEGSGDWALRIAEQVHATQYINPVSGRALFENDKFSSSGIQLSFLEPHEIVYPQRGPFEASLSIIDVLMFNGMSHTKEYLKQYSLLPA